MLRQAVDNNNDLKPIFLTARHCIHEGASGEGDLVNLDNMEFYFNYSSPDCNTNEPFDITRYGHPIKGATLIHESLLNDMALLQMKEPPPPHFNVYYSGWSASIFQFPTSAQFYGIHHPQGDIKKISRTSFLFVNPNSPIPTRYNVTWLDGVTEEGSSGSPLYNFNQRVIGALSFGEPGTETCGNTIYGNYGKFRTFWLTSSDVRNALNPIGQSFLIGVSGGQISCYNNDLNLNGNYYPAGDYQPTNHIELDANNNINAAGSNGNLTVYSGADFTFQAGNKITLSPGFHAQAGSNFHATISSCTPMKWIDNSFEYDSSSTYYNEEDSSRVISHKDDNFVFANPNPFSNFTNINYSIKEMGQVTVEVYSAFGLKVATLVNNQNHPSGTFNTTFDASNLSNGIYFYTLSAGDYKETKRMVLLR